LRGCDAEEVEECAWELEWWVLRDLERDLVRCRFRPLLLLPCSWLRLLLGREERL